MKPQQELPKGQRLSLVQRHPVLAIMLAVAVVLAIANHLGLESEGPGQGERSIGVRESMLAIDQAERSMFSREKRYTDSLAELDRLNGSTSSAFRVPGTIINLSVTADGKTYIAYVSSGRASCHIEREGRTLLGQGQRGTTCFK